MLWITIRTESEMEYFDAVNFLIQENGTYNILLFDGTSRSGKVTDIQFLHVESVTEN